MFKSNSRVSFNKKNAPIYVKYRRPVFERKMVGLKGPVFNSTFREV